MKILFSKNGSIDLSALTVVGDVIVVKDGLSYKFFVHKISGLTLVDVVKSVRVIDGEYNLTTIFEKKDLQLRTGDKYALDFLIGVFKNQDIKSFLQTAHNILKFKEERWDSDVLSRLYSTEFTADEPTANNRSFVTYLDESLKQKIDTLIESGKSKAEALRQIKDEHKDEFMLAYAEFKKKYPLKSILDD